MPSVKGGLPSGSQHSEEIDETNSEIMPVTFDELTKLLLKQTAKHISEQNEHNAAQLQTAASWFCEIMGKIAIP